MLLLSKAVFFKLRSISVPKVINLADQHLTYDRIDHEIDFILGANDAHVLLEKQMTFGGAIPSVYPITDLGTMLYGNIDRLNTNLPKLGVSAKTEFSSINASTASAENHKVIDLDLNTVDDLPGNFLDRKCEEILNCDSSNYNEDTEEVNEAANKYLSNNIKVNAEGRIETPIPWNSRTVGNLGNNL
jgi:hypothetical protein